MEPFLQMTSYVHCRHSLASFPVSFKRPGPLEDPQAPLKTSGHQVKATELGCFQESIFPSTTDILNKETADSQLYFSLPHPQLPRAVSLLPLYPI